MNSCCYTGAIIQANSTHRDRDKMMRADSDTLLITQEYLDKEKRGMS